MKKVFQCCRQRLSIAEFIANIICLCNTVELLHSQTNEKASKLSTSIESLKILKEKIEIVDTLCNKLQYNNQSFIALDRLKIKK